MFMNCVAEITFIILQKDLKVAFVLCMALPASSSTDIPCLMTYLVNDSSDLMMIKAGCLDLRPATVNFLFLFGMLLYILFIKASMSFFCTVHLVQYCRFC